MEAISAGGKTIPPMVILKGKHLQERWFNCTSIDNDMIVAVSDSDLSNDHIRLEWIKHFDKWSAKSQVGAYLSTWGVIEPVLARC